MNLIEYKHLSIRIYTNTYNYMNIKRIISNKLPKEIQPGRVVLLYGPRRVGKTTLLHEVQRSQSKNVLFLNGEVGATQQALSTTSLQQLKSIIGNHTILIIDEAQHIPGVGLQLKILVDHFPQLAIVASGSASFTLAQQVGEPLTGRKKTIQLYPIAASEIIQTTTVADYLDMLDQRLVYGSYPQLFQMNDETQQQDYLRELVDSYLFRDILTLETIRNPKKIRDLLTMLAFQIGQEVSLSELGKTLELHSNTVYRYLDLLEQSFVVMNVRGFSRNLRKEVTKTSRYYFYDVGIRNALINNFNPLSLRDDVGMLWENYIVMERVKKQQYQRIHSNNYFWRTYDQKEIDWVEERGGKLHGYEIKWKSKAVRPPQDWLKTYDAATYQLITQENHIEFIA